MAASNKKALDVLLEIQEEMLIATDSNPMVYKITKMMINKFRAATRKQ